MSAAGGDWGYGWADGSGARSRLARSFAETRKQKKPPHPPHPFIHPPLFNADCKAEPQCSKYTFFFYPAGDLPAGGPYAYCSRPTDIAPKCLLWAGGRSACTGVVCCAVLCCARLAAH